MTSGKIWKVLLFLVGVEWLTCKCYFLSKAHFVDKVSSIEIMCSDIFSQKLVLLSCTQLSTDR